MAQELPSPPLTLPYILDNLDVIMAITQEIQRRIKLKQAEVERIEDQIMELRAAIRSAQAYIQGLSDILPKAMREEGSPVDADERAFEIRPGTASDTARKLIEAKGEPMHINDILLAMGKEPNKQNKVSLGGTLARFVRDQVVFTRPAPNTFGLFSIKEKPVHQPETPQLDLPEDFGK